MLRYGCNGRGNTAICKQLSNCLQHIYIESFFRLAQALGVTPNDLAPVAYGFSKTDEQLKGLLDQFQLLSEKDKQYFIKTATIFMSGLLIQSAT